MNGDVPIHSAGAAHARLDALRAFEQWCRDYPGAIPYSVALSGKRPRAVGDANRHAVIVLMQHGDEWGALPVLLELLPWLRRVQEQTSQATRLTLILGNPQAAECGERFITHDLNRCYPNPVGFADPQRGAAEPAVGASDEQRRAHAIAGVVATADMVLDVHQTRQATAHPFFVFPYHPASVALAEKMMAARVLLTRPLGHEGHSGCIDDFSHALDIPLVAIEVGQRGDNPMSRVCARQAMAGFAELFFAGPESVRMRTPLHLISITRRYTFSSKADSVVDGLINLSPVCRGTLLMTDQETAIAPNDGFVVFIQRPHRNADGLIAGTIPRTALCFVEEFRHGGFNNQVQHVI